MGGAEAGPVVGLIIIGLGGMSGFSLIIIVIIGIGMAMGGVVVVVTVTGERVRMLFRLAIASPGILLLLLGVVIDRATMGIGTMETETAIVIAGVEQIATDIVTETETGTGMEAAGGTTTTETGGGPPGHDPPHQDGIAIGATRTEETEEKGLRHGSGIDMTAISGEGWMKQDSARSALLVPFSRG